MSLSGSIGTSEAKFPGQARDAGLPPTPTPENPGAVFPASDPNAAPDNTIPGTGGPGQPVSDVGNPFQLRDILSKVDHALAQAISSIEQEQEQTASSGEQDPVLQKLREWQSELGGMMSGNVGAGRGTTGSGGPSAQEGGLFTD